MSFYLGSSLLVFLLINYCHCYVSFKDYAVIKVYPKTVSELNSITEIKSKFGRDVDFWSEPNTFLTPVTFDINPRSKTPLLNHLNYKNVNFTIETNNLNDWIEEDRKYIMKRMAADVNLHSIDFEQYYPYQQIINILKSLQNKYPSIVSYSSIGRTFEKREIPSLTLDSNPQQKKPSIVFECGIHAREWVSPATCLWIINDLLTTNSGKKLLDRNSYHFIVVTNPDGYVHTWTTNRMWRKNRSPGIFNFFYDCSGVDLNRNFDTGFKVAGASNDNCEDIYRGKFAFSEKETQSVRDFVQRLSTNSTIDLYFSVHSYTQVWMYPFSYMYNVPDNNDEYDRLSKMAVAAIEKTHQEKYKYGNAARVMYISSGTSIDWVERNKLSKFSFALELRDTGKHGFRLPSRLIKPTAEEVWNGIKEVIYNM